MEDIEITNGGGRRWSNVDSPWGSGLSALDWPSVWGWYALLIANIVPYSWNNSCQNVLVNMESRSEMMLIGTLCRWTTSLIKISTTWVVVNCGSNAKKWLCLDIRSITIKMVDFLDEGGKWVMKSIATACLEWLVAVKVYARLYWKVWQIGKLYIIWQIHELFSKIWLEEGACNTCCCSLSAGMTPHGRIVKFHKFDWL